MNERYTGSDSEAQEQREGEEQFAQWVADHPEIKISPENIRECGPEIAELEERIASFESTYSLEGLNSIVNLTPEEASQYPVRESAKAALIPIVEKLNILKKETNISSEQYEELKAKYKHLSSAVGIINDNKVDHGR